MFWMTVKGLRLCDFHFSPLSTGVNSLSELAGALDQQRCMLVLAPRHKKVDREEATYLPWPQKKDPVGLLIIDQHT
jgi:hypothetical protein